MHQFCDGNGSGRCEFLKLNNAKKPHRFTWLMKEPKWRRNASMCIFSGGGKSSCICDDFARQFFFIIIIIVIPISWGFCSNCHALPYTVFPSKMNVCITDDVCRNESVREKYLHKISEKKTEACILCAIKKQRNKLLNQGLALTQTKTNISKLQHFSWTFQHNRFFFSPFRMLCKCERVWKYSILHLIAFRLAHSWWPQLYDVVSSNKTASKISYTIKFY